MSTTATESTPIKVGLHAGNVITYLSHLYGTGFAVLREAVQNSMDKNANNILVCIHCTRGIIKVYDDGEGADKQEISKKFGNIGLSNKIGDNTKMGSKGIGNLAGLAVAREWQFVSRKGASPFFLYTFDKKELEKGDGINVYNEIFPGKQIDREINFPANSMLRLLDVSETILKQLGDKDSIEKTLREAFNTKLRVSGINLRISYTDFKNRKSDFVIKSIPYRGAPMDIVSQDSPNGLVDFALFYNPSPTERPQILVLHQGTYSIPLINFFKLKVLPPEIEKVFLKGYFEGEIRLGFCSINGSRTCFEHNADLKVFVDIVKTFAEDVLKPIIEQIEQSGREERLHKIADSILKNIKTFLVKHPSFIPPSLKTMVFKATEGTEQNIAGIRKPADPNKSPTNAKKKEPLPPDALKRVKKESEEKKKSGQQKTSKGKVVDFSDGLGIQFIYPDPDTDGFLWHSRTSDRGVVQINIASDDFLESEKRGKDILSRYLTNLLWKEIICASIPEFKSEGFNEGFELMMSRFWKSSFR